MQNYLTCILLFMPLLGYSQKVAVVDVQKVFEKFGKRRHLKLTIKDSRQGQYVSNSLNSSTGVKTLIQETRDDQENGWEVVIFEVGNESFCICMPPPKSKKNKFWMFDALPRPQFYVRGAYARVHNNIEQLQKSLEFLLAIKENKERKRTQDFTIYVVTKLGAILF